jgi:ribosomal protein S18 acetylase RimI-like enzyme
MNELSTVTDTQTQHTPTLRPMNMSDLVKVVKIINAHDEDDGEAAEKDYLNNGVENQFVLEHSGKIIGVTGYREVTGTDQTAWLTWTYLDEAFHGKGFGKKMVSDLLDKLRSLNARKIFTKVSDYDDPDEGKIYERALKTYKSLGFEEEVISHDFYDEDEGQIILGLHLRQEDSAFSEEELKIAEEKPIIRFDGLFEIAETEGAYTFSWIVKDTKKLFGKRCFSVEDLVIGLQSVKSSGGRKTFLTFPSNLPLIHTPLQAAGFKYVGRLENYYEQGVHEFHFTHDLSNL